MTAVTPAGITAMKRLRDKLLEDATDFDFKATQHADLSREATEKAAQTRDEIAALDVVLDAWSAGVLAKIARAA